MRESIDIKKELPAITGQILHEDLTETLLSDYQAEMEALDGGKIEAAYRAGISALSAGLNEKQAEMLRAFERLSEQMLRYAAQFGFAQGVHAGFRLQLVGDAPRYFFETLAEQEFLHPTKPPYAMWRTESLALMQSLQDELGDILRAHAVSVESRWDECSYGILRHAFYLGCRYAVFLTQGNEPPLWINEKLWQVRQAMGFSHNP